MDNDSTIIMFHPLLLKTINELSNGNDDVASLLKEIYEVTSKIRKVYLEIMNNPSNMPSLIDKLIVLKMEEDDYYSYMGNLPLDLVKSIDKISNILKNIKDEEQRLIYRRILSTLEIILMLSDSSFLMLGENYFKNNRSFKFLIDNGVSYEEAVIFFQNFKYNFEKSISFRYITVINQEISKTNSKKEKEELNKIKLNSSFVRGDQIEDALLESSFTTVPNNLNKEISPNYGIDPTLKMDFLQIQALLSLHLNIIKLSTINIIDNYTKQLIFEFKTFLLYLNKQNTPIFEQNLYTIPFASREIKKILLETIQSVDKDRSIHNSDSISLGGLNG